MRTLSRTLITFLFAVVIGGIAVGACLAALIPGTVEIATAHHYTAKQVGKLKALAQPTTIYWNDGSEVLGTVGLEARQTLSSLNGVPKGVTNAVIATEDRSFWTNDGIDLGAVFRAFLTNVTSGKIEQGGSTITQQLVKNRILTPKRDVNRKVKEIEDALRLNEKFSKDKILTEYLNTVYFGSGSYGIKAAAARFFLTVDPGAAIPRGKRLDELTIGESALLAGLISNPEGNSPFTYPDRAIRRRADVLRGEVEQKYITQAEADAANNEPLPTVSPPAEIRPTNLLVSEVQGRLLADTRLGNTPKERLDKVLKGGLKVYTTFDQNLQNMAVDATNNAKPQYGADWISSLVAIEPSTGAVKAMVGGTDFATSQYNVATHDPGRQPGSTWKVITLAGALQAGYSPNDQIDGTAPCAVPSQFPGVPADQLPTNSDGDEGGLQTLWNATSNSVNCAFVRLSTSVGQDNLIKLAHAMGIQQQTLQKVLNLSIGTIEATPLEMATVMATIANNGVHHTPYVVAKVVNADGTVLIDETNNPGDKVLDPDVARCEQNVLRGVVTHGTGTAAEVGGETIFGKTGTTDNRANAWFIGAVPSLATSVWFGNQTGNVGGAGFGGVAAAPIFQAFMRQALAGVPDAGLPDAGPDCARPGAFVNPDGGRDLTSPNAPIVAPLPQVQQLPTTPATPASPSPPPIPTFNVPSVR